MKFSVKYVDEREKFEVFVNSFKEKVWIVKFLFGVKGDIVVV